MRVASGDKVRLGERTPRTLSRRPGACYSVPTSRSPSACQSKVTVFFPESPTSHQPAFPPGASRHLSRASFSNWLLQIASRRAIWSPGDKEKLKENI